jgi:hypothetical protein
MASRKKKKHNLTLGDALAKLSAARTKGDWVKYNLIEKQIVQEEQKLAHQRSRIIESRHRRSYSWRTNRSRRIKSWNIKWS